MFGDSAQGTGIFPTAVKKADGSIIEKPLELEGEGGSSVNYELEFFQQKLSAWNILSKPMQCVLLSYMRYIDDNFSATSDANMIFEGSGGFMFGESAQGTGICNSSEESG